MSRSRRREVVAAGCVAPCSKWARLVAVGLGCVAPCGADSPAEAGSLSAPRLRRACSRAPQVVRIAGESSNLQAHLPPANEASDLQQGQRSKHCADLEQEALRLLNAQEPLQAPLHERNRQRLYAHVECSLPAEIAGEYVQHRHCCSSTTRCYDGDGVPNVREYSGDASASVHAVQKLLALA